MCGWVGRKEIFDRRNLGTRSRDRCAPLENFEGNGSDVDSG